MRTTKRLTIDNVNLEDQREMDALADQMFSIGMARVRAEGDELRRKGLLDEHGKLLVTELQHDFETVLLAALLTQEPRIAGPGL
jgi:hypothetical protein